MPIVKLEYNLPEEQDEFDAAINGSKYLGVIQDLDDYLRSILKYRELTDVEQSIYQEIRNKLSEFRNDI